jgi:hypothetical protein
MSTLDDSEKIFKKNNPGFLLRMEEKIKRLESRAEKAEGDLAAVTAERDKLVSWIVHACKRCPLEPDMEKCPAELTGIRCSHSECVKAVLAWAAQKEGGKVV